MFEYWSWRERAVVIGLAAVAAVLAVLVYMGMQRETELQQQASVLQAQLQQKQQRETELQRQVSALQTQLQQKETELQELQRQASALQAQLQQKQQRETELQRQVSALQAQVQKLSQFEGAFPVYAEWRQQGQYCVLRLNILAEPGVWVKRGQRNGTGGGYYAILYLVDDEESVIARGVLRFTVHDPEVWFKCDQQGRAVAVEQAQFKRRNGFYEYAVLLNSTLMQSRFPCDGLCGLETPLARPIKPKYIDVLVAFYPRGVDGYAVLPWNYGYAVRIPVR